MTEAELRAAVTGGSVTDRNIARAYLTHGHALIVNFALQHGWSRSFEDNIRSIVRSHRMHTGKPPSVGVIDEHRWGAEEVAYYARHGQELTLIDLKEVVEAREAAGRWFPVSIEYSPDKKRYRLVRFDVRRGDQ